MGWLDGNLYLALTSVQWTEWMEEEGDVGVMAGTSEVTLLIGQNTPDWYSTIHLYIVQCSQRNSANQGLTKVNSAQLGKKEILLIEFQCFAS